MTNYYEIDTSYWHVFSSNYFAEVLPVMSEKFDNYYYRLKYGEQTPYLYNNLTGADMTNNYLYLYTLFLMIYMKYGDSVEESQLEEIFDEYQINCIKNTFICWGYNISKLIELLKNLLFENSNIKNGIGYMYIDGPDVDNDGNPFIVT